MTRICSNPIFEQMTQLPQVQKDFRELPKDMLEKLESLTCGLIRPGMGAYDALHIFKALKDAGENAEKAAQLAKKKFTKFSVNGARLACLIYTALDS